MDELDLEIKRLEEWIDRAATSLLTFYDSAEGGFRRSTLGSAGDGASATSSARALFALAEYVRFLQERADPADDKRLASTSDALLQTTETWALGLIDAEQFERIRSTSDNKMNHFTDSHLLMAVSLVPRLSAVFGDRLKYDGGALRAVGERLHTDLVDHLKSNNGGKIHDDDPATHDFITLHALRAIDASAWIAGCGAEARTGALVEGLGTRIERDALALLGYHSAHVYAQWDPAELLFTAALLERCETPNWTQLVSRTVEVVVNDQTEDGAWRGSRVVAYEKRNLLHVASYEVGLTLTFLAPAAIRREDEEMLDRLLLGLRRVCALARVSFQTYGDYSGWSNDRTRWPELIESWATAIVLTMLLRCRQTLLDVRQFQILRLRNYRCQPAARNHSPIKWTDLYRTLCVPHDAAGANLDEISDPSPNGELVAALRDEILTPIMADPAERPAKAGLILHGRPGTRKTTMVKELAKALGWPMITLSPPDFLGDGGLDGFEAAAARVFNDLNRLRRVVVLFDECEDFFRPRPTARRKDDAKRASDPAPASDSDRSPTPETRTIGAFITAGMLPRLQDLRDAKWTIFVLATNVGLDDLDSAAIRPGRFDFAQDIDDPELSAQERYVTHHRTGLTEAQRAVLMQAVREVATQMPFRAIDEAAKALRKGQASEVEPVKRLIEIERKRDRPPTLY
jgi:hypothetical protein